MGGVTVFNKEDIMMIEFEYYNVEMLALFNESKTTEQEARAEIELYPICIPQKTIIINREQFVNVFR